MRRRAHLRAVVTAAGFGRLLLTRLAGQFGDGVLQAGLAGAVLFNPERQADAADVAAGFAVLLLPYSLVGPFAGVLIDRWRRQRVLTIVNLARTAGVLLFALGVAAGLDGLAFYAVALVLISLARFLLSALSAALPRLVGGDDLVTANAFSTTAGTIAATLGGAAALGVRALVGSDDGDYAVVLATAALPFVLAAAAAAGFAGDALGPSDTERGGRETARQIAHGLLAGARHVASRAPVWQGLLTIGLHRLGYGVTTVCTVLLYRNYFRDDGIARAGLAGLTQIVAMIALGGAAAALVTPAAYRRFGARGWPALLLFGSAAVQLGLVLTYRLPLFLLAALLLSFAAQGIKISVDTVVQRHVDDAFRGRVFAGYDTLFNLTLVLAAVLTATVLPGDGRSPAAVVVIAAGYVLVATTQIRVSIFR